MQNSVTDATDSTHSRFIKGFSTVPETPAQPLRIEGKFPDWLSGTLVRNGPGQFDIGSASGKTHYRHWFDGLALLHAFTFNDGLVTYTSRYLNSPAYRQDNETGKINFRSFATDPCRSIFKRAMTLFNPDPEGGNANVNITRLADEYIAMTETPMAIAFDPRTLETRREFHYEDGQNGDARLSGQVTTAHPHYDYERKLGYNYLLKISGKPIFQIHTIDGKRRKLLAKIPSQMPAYIHSFAMTERYIVLAEFSFVLPNLLSIPFGDKPFIENYKWLPDYPSRFHIIDKDTGELVRTVETDAFFSFHHVNAFERDTDSGGEIVLDICAYPDATLIQQLMIERLRSADAYIDLSYLRRYRIPLNGGRASYERIGAELIELPRIDYQKHNGKPYRMTYGVGAREGQQDFLSQLVKFDVEQRKTWIWSEPDCYPGEPVFIPAPDAKSEDDGVLLSVVLDATKGTSFMLALDARTLTEIARANAPVAVPFGFHGQFFGV